MRRRAVWTMCSLRSGDGRQTNEQRQHLPLPLVCCYPSQICDPKPGVDLVVVVVVAAASNVCHIRIKDQVMLFGVVAL